MTSRRKLDRPPPQRDRQDPQQQHHDRQEDHATHALVSHAPGTPTVPSPLCLRYAPCPRAGRAVLLAPIRHGDAVNRAIVCVTCGATGEESRNTAGQVQTGTRRPTRDLLIRAGGREEV